MKDWKEQLAGAFGLEVPAEPAAEVPAEPVSALKQQGKRRIDVRLEKKGRAGKCVTVLLGLVLDDEAMALLARDIKRHCGVGGTVDPDGYIIVQGDCRKQVVDFLTKQGFAARVV